MSWLSNFIRSSAAKALWNMCVQIFVLKLGKGGKDIIEAAKKAAAEAELSGKTGPEKKAMVGEALKLQFRELKSGLIDTAVQLAWAWVDEFLKENDGNLVRLSASVR